MNTQVGSGSSFLEFTPLLWERRRLTQVRPQTDTQPAEFHQETVAGLSQPLRLFTSDHPRVEDVQGSSREEIRDKGVVGGADSSRLEEKASAISSRSASRVFSKVREGLREHRPTADSFPRPALFSHCLLALCPVCI